VKATDAATPKKRKKKAANQRREEEEDIESQTVERGEFGRLLKHRPVAVSDATSYQERTH